MKWTDLDDHWCPVARTLSVLGDRWTLLLLRDACLGVTRFEDFVSSLEATRHVVAGRLKRLVDTGILEKRAYREKPLRYEYVLTEKGRALEPALSLFRQWGLDHLPVRRPAGRE